MSEEVIPRYLTVLGPVAFAVLLLSACSGPGSDEWATRCRANGGHVMKQHVYKSSLYLCLTKDGRIIELPE